MLKLSVGGAVTIGLISAIVFGAQSRENYTISPRSDVPVIEIRGGGAEPVITTIALYGDDRLVRRTEHRYESSRSKDTSELRQLTHEEARELMAIAIDGGLIGMTWEDLEQKVREKTGGKPINIQHPGSLKIRYRLDAFGATGEPVDFTFDCMCAPGVMKFHHEDVPEVVALSELMSTIGNYVREAE